jgi:phage antirepressor YoqD-like protein
LQIQNELQNEQLKIAAPKILYVDEVLQSKSTYNQSNRQRNGDECCWLK